MNVLERAFISEVFYPDYGDDGLSMITPQERIYNDSTGENYEIDFVLRTKSNKYAIETDGLYYHASNSVPKEYFDKLQRKQNEIVNQGYKLIRFTSTNIQKNPKDAMYELRRALIADKDMVKLRMHMTGQIRPHEIQQEALDALKETRDVGNNKGVVVFATGVGKTYLSAFDAKQFKAHKILFVVHINEILRQSEVSFEDVLIDRIKEMGFYYGNEKDLSKNILFASVQTLSREKNMKAFPEDHFDYIIIDETHHVAAPSYSRIFEYFKPKFFLGLTATPDRMDKKDILSHFDNNLVYEIDQKTAITKGMLVPYKYFGFKDNVDYSDIEWNGYRYSVTDLNKALLIEKRDEAILNKFDEYCKGKKTIGFCVSIEHAKWMTKLFNDNGIKAIDIHSNADDQSIDTELSKEAKDRIKDFKNDKYQVAFVVNMFNEGVDIKEVDCLLFLRPTESKTIFIQQMGRGLRLAPNKKDVVILDFIGNYKTATSILHGLGLENLGNMEKKTGEHGEKLLYLYDNNGSEVYFQDEVVDVLRELKSRETKEVDHSLIDEEWEEYAQFVKDSSENNLYLKIGQQNKHIPVQLEAINIVDQNPGISEKDFISEITNITKTKYPQTSMQAGFRGLMISKVLGLITTNSPLEPTKVYRLLQNDINKLDFQQTDKYKDIITNQVEKISYWNPIYGSYNKYRSKDDRVNFKVLSNYPVIFINLVLVELRNRYGYADGRLSREEFNFFIVFAKNLYEYEMVAELISRYRQYLEKPELRKMLKDASRKGDSRLYSLLEYVDYYSYNPQGIKLKESKFDKIKEQSDYVKTLLENKKIITCETEEIEYFKMLYSTDSFVDFHKKHQA